MYSIYVGIFSLLSTGGGGDQDVKCSIIHEFSIFSVFQFFSLTLYAQSLKVVVHFLSLYIFIRKKKFLKTGSYIQPKEYV